MMDMALEKQLQIDVEGLAKRLGCPVVPMTASRNKGIDELKDVIFDSAAHPCQAEAQVIFPASVQEAVSLLATEVEDSCAVHSISPQWFALKLLEGRITSYNVCYTKLLRFLHHRLMKR